jgi:hypothetical protein
MRTTTKVSPKLISGIFFGFLIGLYLTVGIAHGAAPAGFAERSAKANDVRLHYYIGDSTKHRDRSSPARRIHKLSGPA